MTNLVTSCIECNLGKKDKELSDQSSVKKSRRQMEELQERREQLEMMMRWKEGLRDLEKDTVARIATYWADASGYSLNEHGKKSLKLMMRKFSIDEITTAIDKAIEQYSVLEADGLGRITQDSCEKAFSKIGGICHLQKVAKDKPEINDLYYIRGILKNRLSYCDQRRAIQYLKTAYDLGVSLDELKMMATSVRNWTEFVKTIEEYQEIAGAGEVNS